MWCRVFKIVAALACMAAFSALAVPAADAPATPPADLPSANSEGIVVATPAEDTTNALKLPDAGLQSRCWSGPSANYLPRANVLYARFTWKDWGATGAAKIGHYKGWLAEKRYMGLRMYCNSPGELPAGVDIPTADGGGGGKVIPVYWDPKFFDAHKKFVQAVAKEIGENPYLSFIDIGGVGNSGGEWLIYGDYGKYGYTDQARDKLVWDTVKLYREAFPHVRLYLASAAFDFPKDKNALFDYMKKNNIGVRLDGLCGETIDKKGWQYRAKINELWKDFPFQWEGAFDTMEWEKHDRNWDTGKVMDAALDFGPQMITYADADRDALRFEQDAIKRAILDKSGLHLGYRIAITRAEFPGKIMGGQMRVSMQINNRGCSRIYADREMELSFLSADGIVRFTAKAKPQPPTSTWLPGAPIAAVADFIVPKGMAGSAALVAIGMLDEDPRRPDTLIEMAMVNKTADSRYCLGKVTFGPNAGANPPPSTGTASAGGGTELSADGTVKPAEPPPPPPPNPERDAEIAKIRDECTARICAHVKAGANPMIGLMIKDRAEQATVVSADLKTGLTVKVNGAKSLVEWATFTPALFADILIAMTDDAKADAVQDHLLIALCQMAGKNEIEVAKELSVIEQMDNSVMADLRARMTKLK